MMAVMTTITAEQLPDSLKNLRRAIEQAVPHGRTHQVPSLTHNNLFIIYCFNPLWGDWSRIGVANF